MKITVTHFSDILCIWAYVSQIRMEELESEFNDKVDVDYRLFPVFGDVPGKINKSWRDRDGYHGYGKHVIDVASGFSHIRVNADAWQKTRPASSLPAHLYLCATRLLIQDNLLNADSFSALAKQLRESFFVHANNIAREPVLDAAVKALGFPLDAIKQKIQDGSAFASLSADMAQAKELNVRASPTLIFNDDRQRLTGNVGYKIIQANIRELLEQPAENLSWC